jgi:hypothetical protein
MLRHPLSECGFASLTSSLSTCTRPLHVEFVVLHTSASRVRFPRQPENVGSLKLHDVVYTLSPSGVRTWCAHMVVHGRKPRHTLLLQERLNGFVTSVHPSLYLSDLDTLPARGDDEMQLAAGKLY